MKNRKALLITLAVLLALVVVPVAAFAQGGPDGVATPAKSLMRALTDTAAQTLGMSPQDFLQALRDGKTPAELAQEAGVPTEDLAAAMQATWNAQGEIIIGKFIENGLPPKPQHPHPKRNHARLWIKVSAETLDMPVRDFVKAMAAGQTPAEIAADHDSSGDALVAAIVAAEKARLDQAVADGKLTQEQADQILAKRSERAATWVANGFPAK